MRFNTIILVVSLCLAVVGTFFVVKVIHSNAQGQNPESEDTAILEAATNSVPPLVLPPKPAGKVTTKMVPKQVTQTVPVTTWQHTRIGFITTQVPHTVLTTRQVETEVPETHFVDANPVEVAKWNQAVADAQKKYKVAFDAKVAELVKEKNAKKWDDRLEAFVSVTKSTIIPLITAITGLLGAITALWKTMTKAKPETPATPSKAKVETQAP